MHPQRCVLLNGEELERVGMHPAPKEAGPLGCPMDSPDTKIKGKGRLWRLSPIARLAAGVLASSSLALWACPVTSVAEQQSRPLPLPGPLIYTGREAGICPLPGSLMAECPFPQAFTMAESLGCCSVWARCLHCLYSCHWRKCPRERMQTSKCDCIWFGLLFLTFLLSLSWLYIGLVLLNDLHNFNEFLFHHWGHWMDWSLAFLLVISLLVTYASLLLVLALLLQLCRQPLHLHSLHKVLLLLIMLLVAAGLVGLDIQWQQEWHSLHVSLQATAPFLHVGAVAGITLLAWPVADTFCRIHRRGDKAAAPLTLAGHSCSATCTLPLSPKLSPCPFLKACPPLPTGPKILLLLLFFGVVLVIYLAPLCISSPCIMEPRDLPPKPGLVGHRGAPMVSDGQNAGKVGRVCSPSAIAARPVGSQAPTLPCYLITDSPCQLAPENTLMSLRKTAECGATVFETDVMISSDGIPFLMHDEHLSRTTNVASVFPNRITAHSSDFSWAELKRLNAGAWFLERRPFWGAKPLAGPDQKEAESQTVPALEELLKEAAALNLSIMFDLRRPPQNHTYYDTFVIQTLETVLNARVPQAMVMLPGHPLPTLPSLGHDDDDDDDDDFETVPGPRALPQLTYPILWSNLSAPVPALGIPRSSPASHPSFLNHRSSGYLMKTGLTSNDGHLECARYMDIREATGLISPSFSTSRIKICHCWISKFQLPKDQRGDTGFNRNMCEEDQGFEQCA
ncbi:Glycerophosphoinositol inositolphosphodiesterase GDPD2 [Plecturocebus cupreus]